MPKNTPVQTRPRKVCPFFEQCEAVRSLVRERDTLERYQAISKKCLEISQLTDESKKRTREMQENTPVNFQLRSTSYWMDQVEQGTVSREEALEKIAAVERNLARFKEQGEQVSRQIKEELVKKSFEILGVDTSTAAMDQDDALQRDNLAYTRGKIETIDGMIEGGVEKCKRHGAIKELIDIVRNKGVTQAPNRYGCHSTEFAGMVAEHQADSATPFADGIPLKNS